MEHTTDNFNFTRNWCRKYQIAEFINLSRAKTILYRSLTWMTSVRYSWRNAHKPFKSQKLAIAIFKDGSSYFSWLLTCDNRLICVSLQNYGTDLIVEQWEYKLHGKQSERPSNTFRMSVPNCLTGNHSLFCRVSTWHEPNWVVFRIV